jgi:hypothetical protein
MHSVHFNPYTSRFKAVIRKEIVEALRTHRKEWACLGQARLISWKRTSLCVGLRNSL